MTALKLLLAPFIKLLYEKYVSRNLLDTGASGTYNYYSASNPCGLTAVPRALKEKNQ